MCKAIQITKSRQGRQTASFVPTGLGAFPNRVPSTKVLGYFHGGGGNKAEVIFTNSKSGAIFRGKPQPYAERMIDDSSRLKCPLKIAQHFSAGSFVPRISKSRQGRQTASFVPTGLGAFPNRVPSTKVLGYFHGGHQPNTKVLGYFQGGNKVEAIIMGTNGWAIFRGKPQPFAERVIDDSSRLKCPLIIAQHFSAGSFDHQIFKSRQGRQTISFVPDGTGDISEPCTQH